MPQRGGGVVCISSCSCVFFLLTHPPYWGNATCYPATNLMRSKACGSQGSSVELPTTIIHADSRDHTDRAECRRIMPHAHTHRWQYYTANWRDGCCGPAASLMFLAAATRARLVTTCLHRLLGWPERDETGRNLPRALAQVFFRRSNILSARTKLLNFGVS